MALKWYQKTTVSVRKVDPATMPKPRTVETIYGPRSAENRPVAKTIQ